MAESNKDNEMPNVPDDLAGGKTDEVSLKYTYN